MRYLPFSSLFHKKQDFIFLKLLFVSPQSNRNWFHDRSVVLLKETSLTQCLSENRWFWSKPKMDRRIWWKSAMKRAFSFCYSFLPFRAREIFCLLLIRCVFFKKSDTKVCFESQTATWVFVGENRPRRREAILVLFEKVGAHWRKFQMGRGPWVANCNPML